MKTQLKFQPGDKVWFIKHDRILSGEVSRIEIILRPEHAEFVRYDVSFTLNSSEGAFAFSVYHAEADKYIFATKESLIASL